MLARSCKGWDILIVVVYFTGTDMGSFQHKSPEKAMVFTAARPVDAVAKDLRE